MLGYKHSSKYLLSPTEECQTGLDQHEDE